MEPLQGAWPTAPDGVEWALAVANRNVVSHQYDEINRELTSATRRSRIVLLAVWIATDAASSQGWVLVPMRSVTL